MGQNSTKTKKESKGSFFLMVEMTSDESNFLLQKFVDSLIDKIYLCKLKEYYLNCYAEE